MGIHPHAIREIELDILNLLKKSIMKSELELLQQIDLLHQWLQQEPNGRFEHGQLLQPDGYAYARKAKELFNLVRQLRDTYHPDYVDITDHDINDILRDEVWLVESSYPRTQNTKVQQKDKDTFERSLYDANNVIDRHLYTLFAHIGELKSSTESSKEAEI